MSTIPSALTPAVGARRRSRRQRVADETAGMLRGRAAVAAGQKGCRLAADRRAASIFIEYGEYKVTFVRLILLKDKLRSMGPRTPPPLAQLF
jgi:hypothetical protein